MSAEKLVQTLRERLEKELALNDEQKTKVDAILNTMRSKMEAASQTPENERRKIIEDSRSEMQEQVAAILTEEQKKEFEKLIASFETRRANTTQGRIYIMDGGPREMNIRLGLTDGTMTEVLSPEIEEGMEVIVGTLSGQGGGTGAQRAPAPPGPRMF